MNPRGIGVIPYTAREALEGRIAFTVNEFCKAFGVSRTLVYEEIKAGRVQSKKAGRRTLIPVQSALEWLEALPDGAVQ